MTNPAGTSLYERLGGYDALAAAIGIQGPEREEFLAAAGSLKGDIVQAH